MGLFSGLFGGKPQDPNDVRVAILAYCYGNMVAIAFQSLDRFVEIFRKDPTRALKARLFSAGAMRAGVSIDQNRIGDVSAAIVPLNSKRSLLLFDFSAYGGLFKANGQPAICPSYVGIAFDNACAEPPAIYLLEPSFQPDSTMLIRLGEGGSRANLGEHSANRRDAFVETIRSRV